MKSILLLASAVILLGSTKPKEDSMLDLMQGIWKARVDPLHPDSEEESWTIIRNHQSLSVTYVKSSNKLDFPLTESIEGFQELKKEDIINGINVSILTDSGTYYTLASTNAISPNGWVNNIDLFIIKDFDCDGQEMSINGGQLVEYSKRKKLSSIALKNIYLRGMQDNRDYLKEYINIDVTEVVSSKSTIYAEPDKPTRMYLIKGDIVTVLEEKEGWIKMEYEGKKLITGWIKKEDTKK
ncbi:MAG: hypothetical protein LBK47_09540 [Prevotellaceae bacterium]|jgi:hypothetical protein|nr:hypothetical protein [Prevotellaceae bacterium]